MPARHLLVVPHTHWDREWYRTHESFRYRLVGLLDDLLDLLERDPDFRHFTLDGQVIALDDYLEVRPAERERVAKLVREGRLLIGPWTVLPDEWLVSGEALIRNLRCGLTRAAAFGGGMRLGYVPDQFGHVGQLPQLFAGFGFEAAVLWRGVGADVDQTCFRWEAPDGTALFCVYLIRGYGNATGLPLEPRVLARRLEAAAEGLAPHSRIPSLLLMNGSDHAPPQPGLPRALAAAAAELADTTCEIGTLPGFVARARAEAPADLPLHRGELRSGLRAPLLEGCASARIPQKRADFENDRLLTRYLEPLATWLGALGGEPDPEMIDHAWRIALENHPHDSICGCSIDAVHAQMEPRFARVAELAGAHLARVARELGPRVALPPAEGEGVLVWNPNAAGRTRAEGVLQLDVPAGRRPPRLHLCDASGRRIPAHVEIADGDAILAHYLLPAPVVAVLVEGFPPEFSGEHVRAVVWRREGERLAVELHMGDEPRPGFDLAGARRRLAEALAEEGERQVAYRVRRLPRLRVRFTDELPGHGLRAYRLRRGTARPRDAARELAAERLRDGGAAIENAVWRIEAAPDGRVRCIHRPSDTRIDDALRLVSEGDRGDEYNFDPVPGDVPVERPERARVRLAPASEAEVGLVLDARYRLPAGLAAGRGARDNRRVWLPARVVLRLAPGLDRVEAELALTNTVRDHRLRLLVRAPFAPLRFEVESAFEVAERPIEPEPDAFGAARPAERPIGATPQRGFATLVGRGAALSVANRGLPEVEAVREPNGDGALAVTLLRAVGWLSRGDLALRPGHAGPQLATPGAQVPGLHTAALAWRLHAPDEAERTAAAHAYTWPPLVFAGGGAGDAALEDGARLVEIDDPAVVVSAIEPRPGGAPIVRLYNASPAARRVAVRWNGPGAEALEPVDLAGRPAAAAHFEPGAGAAGTLALRGWQIASLRPR